MALGLGARDYGHIFVTTHHQMVGFSRVSRISRVRVSVRLMVRFSFSGVKLNRKRCMVNFSSSQYIPLISMIAGLRSKIDVMQYTNRK